MMMNCDYRMTALAGLIGGKACVDLLRPARLRAGHAPARPMTGAFAPTRARACPLMVGGGTLLDPLREIPSSTHEHPSQTYPGGMADA